MKYIKKFNEQHISIYDPKWEVLLPETFSIWKGFKDTIHHIERYTYKKANVMLNADMIQITYDNLIKNQWAVPETLEFDIYTVQKNDSDEITFDIDITWGDEIVTEFSISPPNKVKLIQHTTLGSKFDPNNTVFAFDTKSLIALIKFLNHFNLNLTPYNLSFLALPKD